jgi:hypothetical protein
MSTAAPFRFKQPFPVCVTDLSGVGFSYIDNLTLAQVMPFAWNTETISLTMNGSATKGAASVTCTGSIITNTPYADQYDQGRGGGMWIPSVGSFTGWASWPGPKVPFERVCLASPHVALLGFLGQLSSAPSTNFFDIQFLIGTDPGNAGKYRIYYTFLIAVHATSGGDSVSIVFADPATGAGVTAWQSGTMTLGGFNFSWESAYTPGATPSGTGQMTGSSGSYTY